MKGIEELKVKDLVASPWNRAVDEKSDRFKDLVGSVRTSGVVKPLDVRPYPKPARPTPAGGPARPEGGGGKQGRYEVLDGGRRLRAAHLSGLDTVPAIVHEGLSDAEACDLTYIAFFGREDLSPLEEGDAAAELLERHGGDVAAVASVLGKSPSWVHQRAAIKRLSKTWREAVLNEPSAWTAAHLAIIARLPEAVQDDAYERFGYLELMPVAELDKRINDKYVRLLIKAPWDLEDETLEPEAGACAACKLRSSQGGLLFDDDLDPERVKATDRCLNPSCWRAKMNEFLRRRAVELRKDHADLVLVADEYLGHSTVEDAKKLAGGLKVFDKGSSWKRVKQTTPGAVPALSITGKSIGELQWIKVELGQFREETGRAPGPTPLKERRAKLARRRAAEVIGVTRELLAEAERKDGLVWHQMTAALAVVFGIAGYTYARDKQKRRNWHEVDRLRATEVGVVAFYDELWDQVRERLDGELSAVLNSLGNPESVKRGLAFAERVCILTGKEFKALVAAAAEKIPEPKSWKKLNADGSPKLARRAGGKAAEKKSTTKGTKKAKKASKEEPTTKNTKRTKFTRRAGGKAEKKEAAG